MGATRKLKRKSERKRFTVSPKSQITFGLTSDEINALPKDTVVFMKDRGGLTMSAPSNFLKEKFL